MIRKQNVPTRLIWMMMLAGQLMFFTIAIVLRTNGAIASFSATSHAGTAMSPTIFLIIASVLLATASAASIAIGVLPSRNMLNPMASQSSNPSRLIIRMALLEAPALFAIVTYLLTGSIGGLALAACAIVLFIVTTGPAAFASPR